MPDPAQIAAQIRFALSNLAAANGHYEFEELARHLVRARICSNILPATGPVSARGDQGRDFETFRTYLSEQLAGTVGFLGRASSQTLVFLCTIQERDLQSKLRADVSKVMSSGTSVDRLYALTAHDIPIGARHALQDEVRNEHGVELELIDARAIAELLADPDVFWIAERHLNLPAEIRPERRPSDEGPPGWYVDALARWREPEAHPVSYGDFALLRAGLRETTIDPKLQKDLPFWVDKMGELFDPDAPIGLRLRALYEVVVCHFRVNRNMVPVEQQIETFFSTVEACEDPTLLRDAVVLLTYCIGARSFGLTDIEASCLAEWNDVLTSRVSSLLAESEQPSRRAMLLEVLGLLGLQPDVTAKEFALPDDPVPLPAELARAESGERPHLEIPPGVAPHFVDLDAGMAAWSDLSTQLESVPLFPVENLADTLALLAPLLVEHPLYRDIVDAVDQRLAIVSGDSAAAERCRDRALALLKSDRVLEALDELHQAKVNWWTGDRLRGSLLCMMIISDCYARLSLVEAAKYYALVAASAASAGGDLELLDLVARGLLEVAHLDHETGSWLTATVVRSHGLIAHAVAFDDGDDMEKHPVLKQAAYEQMLELEFATRFVPSLAPSIRTAAGESWALGFVESMASQGATPSWELAEWHELADEQLLGRPFAELAPDRVITWRALGIDWRVRFSDAQEARLAAERLSVVA